MEIFINFLLIDYYGGFPKLSLSLSFMKAPSQAMGRFAASGHIMLTSLSGLNEGFNAVQNNYLYCLTGWSIAFYTTFGLLFEEK